MSDFKLLERRIYDLGASKVAPAYLGNVIPGGYRGLKYAISIAVRLSDAIINEIKDKPTHTYFHHYRSVNSLIDSITLRTMLLLQEWGYLAVAVPASQTVKIDGENYSGIFPHKTAARLSGLGWIGKNALLITPEYGPRVRLGTVITNMVLPVEERIHAGDCGACNICKNACPSMAIQGHAWYEGMPRCEIIDVQACSNYMSAMFKGIGRGSVCGICMRVCPAGNKVIREF